MLEFGIHCIGAKAQLHITYCICWLAYGMASGVALKEQTWVSDEAFMLALAPEVL